MKIPFIFCLVLWITVAAQIGASQIISKNGNKEIIAENGTTNVEVTEPELLDVYVSNNELVFEICSMKCFTEFLVCFESGNPPGQTTSDLVDKRCDTKCGFYVNGNDTLEKNAIDFMLPDERKMRDEECYVAKMRYLNFTLTSGDYYTEIRGCSPKIAENGLVKLNITNASSDCPIVVKNAKLKLDLPTTVLPSNNNPNSPSNSDSKKSPSSKSPAKNIFGNFGCIFVFISICFLHQ